MHALRRWLLQLSFYKQLLRTYPEVTEAHLKKAEGYLGRRRKPNKLSLTPFVPMMFKRLKINIVVLLSLIFIAEIGLAGWTGPVGVISENWGATNNQVGFKAEEPTDSFPRDFWILDEKIVIEDQENRRMKIYSINGQFQNNVNWVIQHDGSYRINEYPLAGVTVGYIDNNLYTYSSPQKDYGIYSPTGQLIKTSTTRPLELGRVKSTGIGSSKYKTTAEYPDITYQFIDTQPTVKYYRDSSKNFYRIETFTTTVGDEDVTAYRVHKYNACSKKVAMLDMPRSSFEPMPPSAVDMPTWKPAPIMEYGEPLVAPNGDIYAWARTKTEYKILKWTWQDDPNVPSGPDAPTNLAVTASINGLYLTWTASPGDPGCVTGYEVSRATTAGGIGSTIATVNAGTVKYNDTTATAGTTYYYKVRAVSGIEYSPFTAEVSGKR
jgi:hypothetical protein